MGFIKLFKSVEGSIYRTRSVKAIKFIIKLFDEVVLYETDACSFLNTKKDDLYKVLRYFIAEEVVNRVRIEGDIVVYTLGHKILNKEVIKCRECKHSKKELKEIDGGKIRFLTCTNPEPCDNKEVLDNRNAVKILMKKAVRSDLEIFNNKGKLESDELDDDPSKWNIRDFSRHTVNMYEEYYPDFAISPSFYRRLNSLIRDSSKYCRELGGNNWKNLFKRYIFIAFDKLKNKDIRANPVILFDKNRIREGFEELGVDLDRIQFCKIKNTNCKYMKDKICMLIRDGHKCTLKIREYMKRRYG